MLSPVFNYSFTHLSLSGWSFAWGEGMAAEHPHQSHMEASFASIFKIKLFGDHLARASTKRFGNSGNAGSGKSSKGKSLIFFFLISF